MVFPRIVSRGMKVVFEFRGMFPKKIGMGTGKLGTKNGEWESNLRCLVGIVNLETFNKGYCSSYFLSAP